MNKCPSCGSRNSLFKSLFSFGKVSCSNCGGSLEYDKKIFLISVVFCSLFFIVLASSFTLTNFMIVLLVVATLIVFFVIVPKSYVSVGLQSELRQKSSEKIKITNILLLILEATYLFSCVLFNQFLSLLFFVVAVVYGSTRFGRPLFIMILLLLSGVLLFK
jgi:predicted nucleic-acid-binding Zn-ribbon protein